MKIGTPPDTTRFSGVTHTQVATTSPLTKQPGVGAPQTGFEAGTSPLPGVDAQLRSLRDILATAREGVAAPTLDARLAALPAIPSAEMAALWSLPAGAAARQSLADVMTELAAAAPSAVIFTNPETGYRQTVKEGALHFRFVDARQRGDRATMKNIAKEFQNSFPDAPINAWVQSAAAE